MGMPQKAAEIAGGWIALIATILIALFLARRQARPSETPPTTAASGHVLLAIGNVAGILTTVVPVAASFITGNSDYMFYLWWFVPVFFACLVFWALGWKRATSRAP